MSINELWKKSLYIFLSLFLVTQMRNELAQRIDKNLSNLEETAPIDVIEKGEGVLDIEEGMYLWTMQLELVAVRNGKKSSNHETG